MLQDIATIHTPWASSFGHIKFPFTEKSHTRYVTSKINDIYKVENTILQNIITCQLHISTSWRWKKYKDDKFSNRVMYISVSHRPIHFPV